MGDYQSYPVSQYCYLASRLSEEKLYGRIKRKTRTRFLEFFVYLRSLYPPEIRIAAI